jgi:hypothetical protein
MTPIEISEQLAKIQVDHAKGFVILTFEMRNTALEPRITVIPKDAALKMAVDLLRALANQPTIPVAETVRMGFPVEGYETGLNQNNEICLSLYLAEDAPVTFALSRGFAEKLGSQLLSDAAAPAWSPPSRDRTN